MKKLLSTLIILSLFINSNAQGIFDAVHFANNSIINGSARYMGMAGSFGAIGGDVSASIENPATLGIFRSSEASVSLGFSPTYTYGNWQGDKFFAKQTSFNFNNLAWVFNFPTYRESGYMSSNLSFSYHKVKDFNRKIYLQSNSNSVVSLTDLMTGFLNDRNPRDYVFEEDMQADDAYSNDNIGWLSVLGYNAYLINPIYKNDEHTGRWNSIINPNEKKLPAYEATESGSINDYNFTYSGNINDRVYFGAGFSFQNISYNISSTYSEYYPAHEDYFYLDNYFSITGYGANFKFGAVVRATDFMRFGLSFQTPTWYSIKNGHTADLCYFENKDENKYGNKYEVSAPEADCWYKFNTPIKTQASVGFVIGKRAAINVDYQFSGKKYSASDDYGKFEVDEDNYAKYLHTVKLGVELRLGDNFKIRGGGAFISAPINKNAVKLLPYNTTRTDLEYFVEKNTYYGTFGVGYAKNNFCIDLAYAYQQQNQDFFAAENFNLFGATLKTHKHNVIATFAFRY